MSAARKLEIVSPDPFALVRGIRRMRAAGFAVKVENGGLVVESTLELSEPQRAFIGFHKPALVALLEDAEALHRALVQAGPVGLAWQAGTPADWSDDRLLASGEVLYGDRRMVSRHGRRFAAESAPVGPDIQQDTASAPPAEIQGTAATCAGKTPDTPPDDPAGRRVAELMAQGWERRNAEARARSEAMHRAKPGARP